jgi:hypothetical protein
LLRLLLMNGLVIFVALFTFVYALLWGLDPHPCVAGAQACHGAFVGAGPRPTVGDFAYVAAQTAFFNPPTALAANSRVVRGVITGEFVCSVVLLAGFAASLGLPEGLWTARNASIRTE